jgi:hypothetical protein
MITGAHIVIYSEDAEKDRTFIRDVLKFSHVDAGDGWLIFALPPAELGVHPAAQGRGHELYLICDDVRALVDQLQHQQVSCSPVEEQSWGSLTQVSLPGGGQLGIYQPRHPQPPQP